MTQHRIEEDLEEAIELLQELKDDIDNRESYETTSDVINGDTRLPHVMFLISRIKWDVAYRAQTGVLHRGDQDAQPSDLIPKR